MRVWCSTSINKRESSPQTPATWLILACLGGLFCVSRIYLWNCGLRPDVTHILWHFQYLDTELLKNDLLRSLTFLHIQPPLWNGIVGVALKLAGGDTGTFQFYWVVASCLLSLGIGAMVFDLTLRTSESRLLASIATSSWFFLGAAYFYENYIFYPLFTALLATLFVWCIFRAVLSKNDVWRTLYLSIAGLALLLLNLTWALFHPIFVSAATATTIFLFPPHSNERKTASRVAIIVVLASLIVPLKNLYLFGTFSSCSWGGYNLSQVAPSDNPERQFGDCRWLLQDAKNCLSEIPELAREYHESHPSLVSCEKSSGFPNFNHVMYISQSRQCSDRALTAIKNQFGRYFANRIAAFRSSFLFLPDETAFPPLGIERVRPLIESRNIVYLPWRTESPRYLGAPLSAAWALFSWVVIVFDLGRSQKGERSAFLAAGLLAGWLLFIGHALNGAEQERMRFTIEPLGIFFCYAALPALLQVIRGLVGSRRRPEPPTCGRD